MYLSRDGLLKSLVGLVAIIVVAAAVLYVLYKRAGDELGFVKVFDEVGRKPDIAGTIDEWQATGDTATTFIEVAPDDFQRFVLTFDKNTKYRQAKTPDVANRTLLKGEFKDLRISRTVEIFLASPPHNGDKQNVVETIIYW